MDRTAGAGSAGKKRRGTKKNTFTIGKEASGFLLGGVGFFIGRVALFQFMNPIALAYVSAFLGTGYKFFAIALLTGIGMLTRFSGVYFLKYVAAMIFMCAVEVIYNVVMVTPGKKLKAASGAAVTLITGLLFAYILGGGTYYLFMALIETALAFSLFFVLQKGMEIIQGERHGGLLDNEALISIALILGAIIAGASDVYIGSISCKYLFCTLIILLMAYKGGSTMGATAGVLFGFILTLSGFSNYSLIGILSIAGMIAGIMKDTGRIGSMLGYAAGGLITSFYLDAGILDLSLLYSVALGCGLFYFFPKNRIFEIGPLEQGAVNESDYGKRIKEVTSERLEGFANSFQSLADIFSSLSEKKPALDQNDISRLIDDTAAKVCTDCPHSNRCWNDNFYTTYQMSFALLEICEKKGSLRLSDFTEEMYGVCNYLENYADGINRMFEIYKNDLLWHNRIVESRDLVSQQLMGVSGIIAKLSKEVHMELCFNRGHEENILHRLGKAGIAVDSVMVMENKAHQYEVVVSKGPCLGRKDCIKEIIPLVNEALGRKMKKAEQDCSLRTLAGKGSQCRLKLVEESKFRIAWGVSRAVKDHSSQSGDSYSQIDMKGSQYLLVLSDGMGSGKRASKESEAAVEMLENFIDAGFDKETAINIINSVLVLKSTEDIFSTLDICSIDMYTGVAEFVKIGASSTFIIRNGQVITVKSSSLPMGILNSVDVETTNKRLKDGDIIVMVTDGLTEIGEAADKEGWIRDALQDFGGVNPQDVADNLLEKAKEQTKGVVSDDMTILAARIWEKI